MIEDWRRNPEYWGAAGAGIIPVAKDTGRFLVPFRSLYVNEPHTWGTIGGKLDALDGGEDEYYDDELDEWVEPDPDDVELEDPEDAAMREFHEETCHFEHPEIVELYVFEDPEVSFTYYNFLGVVPSEFDACLNWETEEWAWITFDELLELEPKHFGLEALLGDPESVKIMLKYARA